MFGIASKPANDIRSPAEQQALLDLALSRSPSIFYTARLADKFPVSFITDNVERITGHKPAAFLADENYRDRQLHPEDRQSFNDAIAALKEKGAATHDYRFATASGGYLWIRDDLRLVPMEDGSDAVVGCMSDITSAENGRIAQLLPEAVNSLTTGFAIFDAEKKLIFANRSLAQTLTEDIDSAAVVGLTLTDLVAQILPKLRSFGGQETSDNPAWAKAIEDRLQGLINESVEIEVEGDRWRLVSGHPTPEGGRVLVSADITDLKQAEARLRASEEQFRTIFEANPLPVRVSVLGTWDMVYESPAAAELFGECWPSEEGRKTQESYVDIHARNEMIRALLTNRRVDNREILMKRKDGSSFWVSLSSRVVPFKGMDVCITSFIDLTEAKEREAALEHARETLQDAIEALSEGFVLYDADNRLVTCNSQYRAYNKGCEDLLKPGAFWPEVTRARGERGFFTRAEGNLEDWLADQMAQRGKAQHEEFPAAGGQWFDYSHRPTRRGGFVSTWRDITRQKTMAHALRESEALVRQVLEACPLPVRMWNVETGRVIYESPACGALFGRDSTNEGREERLSVYVDLDDRRRYLEALSRTNSVDNFEMQLRRADGSSFWSSVSARAIEFKGEDVVVSTIADLTGRKQREAEVLRAWETLDDAIESLPEGFALFDRDDRLILCNSRFREFNELSAHALKPGVPWLDFVRAGLEKGQYLGAHARLEQWKEDRRLCHSASPGAHNIEFQQSDGRWYYAFGQKTRQGGVVVIRIDITEPKQMEFTLRDSEGMVRQVLEACPVPITMNRIEDGTVIYESPAARELLGFPESQEGKSVISRWVDPKDRERYLDQLRKDGGVDGLEIRFRKADGEEFPCAMSSRLIEYQGESVIVSNLFDLTERKASEDELARQREMLHQSEKLSALGELLAGVSHELNNPLSVLVGQAQMLKELAADEHTATRAKKIGKAADRCARIVKTFLAMARHEPSESVQADINAVVEDALEVTAYALRTSGIDLSLRLAKNLPQIYCDPDQMRQVITNLVINAQHALLDVEGPRKLSVTTHFRKRSDRIAIKVKDNGPGVPEEIRGRIFEPLFTTKEIGTGTGMGLALCHRIVEAHGGTINLESGHGKGSAFAVRLPCAVSKKPAIALPKINQNIAGKHRVLVVDDEYDVGEIISDVLQFDGYAVDVAGSGKTALDLIKRQHYDVILSDIRMPGMDGPTFYRVLSGMESQLINGLAFITGDTLSPQVREFLDAAERPYLEKPLMARDIRELVDLLIRRQHDC